MLYSSQFVAKNVESLWRTFLSKKTKHTCAVDLWNIVTYLLIHVNDIHIKYFQKFWWKFTLIYGKIIKKQLFCDFVKFRQKSIFLPQGWQVTLCDPIWHVIFRSGVVILITNCYICVCFTLECISWCIMLWACCCCKWSSLAILYWDTTQLGILFHIFTLR